MQGNIVSAAKWFGGALVLSSIILVVGLHWSASVTNQQTFEAQIKALDRIDGLLTRLANKPNVPVSHNITLHTPHTAHTQHTPIITPHTPHKILTYTIYLFLLHI